ncbi:MAG: FtsQ-type POTRA domain-containing protein [Peptococcaceae bacterium]|nr:FtsQ-type POTRA domain-containing protein [Peptococcaceae bacterium]
MKDSEQIRYVGKKKKSAAPMVGVGLFLMFCGGMAGYYIANSAFFNLNSIEFRGLQSLDSAALQELSGVVLGVNSLKIPAREVEERIEINPFVKEAKVQLILPAKLLITVTERQPLAQVVLSDRVLAVSLDGVCLQRNLAVNPALPIITEAVIESEGNPGDRFTGDGLTAALELIDRLDPYFLESIQEFRASSSWELTLVTHQGVLVRFGPAENLERKLGYYETILLKNNSQYNGGTVEYVDLRYEAQPVVKKKSE